MRMASQFGSNALKVLCKRYLRPVPDGATCSLCDKTHETPEQMLDRVSFGSEEFYNMMARLDFLPNSPTLFNAGTNQGTYSACFKFDVGDSMESIMEVARKSAFVQKWGGGVGYCLSALRPEGAPIRSTHGRACGPIAVLRLYHNVALMITQGGKREGAQMAILHCDHPNIEEFIHCKSPDSEELSTFNLSVACTDTFMRSVTSSDADSRDSKLLRAMAESAHRAGDPGVYFIDVAERANPTPHLGKLTGTNPCGEVPLLDNEPCNLGSINLSKFVLPSREFDLDRLIEMTRMATRYLDEVLDHNEFPDPLIEQAASVTRKLGLGVMGWADALALMHIHYDSGEAVELGKWVMEIVRRNAWDESAKLGSEKGTFPALEDSLARRNATLTCIAPAGSISVLAGCSSGIEPHFALEGERVMGDGTKLDERVAVMDRLEGFVPKIAHEIGWSWHVAHQAGFQEFTDLAVSKTINMPRSASVEDVHGAFVDAWSSGCKGITIYRDGSRPRQVITSKQSAQVSNGRRRLPRDRKSLTHKFAIGGTEGYLHIGMYEDGAPGEVFMRASKQGSTVDGLLDGIAILTSMALQYGVPLEALANKFRGARFEPSGLTENREIPTTTSLLDYIFRYAAKKFLEGPSWQWQDETGMFCEDCGAPAVFQEGCIYCSHKCGWSRC